MDAGHGTHLAAAQEKRLANNGQPYTRSEFLDWYGDAGERRWEEAAQQEEAAGGPPAHRNAAQLLDVPLPQHVIAPSSGIQAPDLGLSNILIESFVGSEDRAASQVPTAPSHTNLGVAQMGAFDRVRRFYRTDGTFCRVHPGRRPRDDAELVFGHSQ